jgi:hypothetical protein
MTVFHRLEKPRRIAHGYYRVETTSLICRREFAAYGISWDGLFDLQNQFPSGNFFHAAHLNIEGPLEENF